MSKVITCPCCGEDTVIRNMIARKFTTPGPKIRSRTGWTQGVVCQCGDYTAYGRVKDGVFTIIRETGS
jgi:hypothetical protein